MKVEVHEKTNPAYPRVKKHMASALIVLFHAYKCGTVLVPVSNTSRHQLGAYNNEWEEDNFAPFTGSITLQNDC